MDVSDQDDDTGPRKRTVSEQTLSARQVVQLVDPINERIGQWQIESVRLAAAAQRSRQMGRRDGEVLRDIERMLGKVEAEAAMLDLALKELPPVVAGNSRFTDTRRGLQLVADRLRGALAGR